MVNTLAPHEYEGSNKSAAECNLVTYSSSFCRSDSEVDMASNDNIAFKSRYCTDAGREKVKFQRNREGGRE